MIPAFSSSQACLAKQVNLWRGQAGISRPISQPHPSNLSAAVTSCCNGKTWNGRPQKIYVGQQTSKKTQTRQLSTHVQVAVTSTSSTTVRPLPETVQELPQSLRYNVAVLQVANPDAPGGKTMVYVLGISHVSKESVQHTRELISFVQPEVVSLELCKDRLWLLVPPSKLNTSNRFVVGQVSVSGMEFGAEDSGLVTKQDILQWLTIKPGSIISKGFSVERERARLQDTGLFENVASRVAPLGPGEGPAWEVTDDGKAELLLPAGGLELQVTPHPDYARGGLPPSRYILGGHAASGSGQPGKGKLGSGTRDPGTAKTEWRPWLERQPEQVEASPQPSLIDRAFDGDWDAVREYFVELFMTTYAGYQAEAAARVGLEPGAAWQAAVAEAAACGVQQVHLADVPTSVTSKELATSDLIKGSSQRGRMVLQIGPASVLGAVALSALALPGPWWMKGLAGMAAGVVSSIALLNIFAGPFTAIQELAAMPADEIEDTVRLKEPIEGSDRTLVLTGEDALLDWPGFWDPLITDRDRYMARALYCAATGKPVVPAYVRHEVEGRQMMQLMMPEGGPEEACPIGWGIGAYTPLQGVSAVVGVVGTAHVRGIMREWKELTGTHQ